MSGIALTSLLAAYLLAWALGTRPPNLLQMYAGYSLVALILMWAVSIFAHTVTLLVRREPSPLALVLHRARDDLAPAALVDRVLPLLLTFAFFGAFTVFKSLIPQLHPFAWDSTFSDLDRWMFGTDPWRLTHSLIGPKATPFLDIAYILWMPVFTCVVFWHSVFAPFEQKRRFFLTFLSCWIALGVVAATIFSSAGPCFLDLIHHPYAQRYALLPMQHAEGSQHVMDYLAEGYRTGDFGAGKGISAMPSMHVAIVTLYLISARKPWTVLLSAAYFVLIFVGSVHFGWHYAVDGVVAAAGTLLIYFLTGRSWQPLPSAMTAPPAWASETGNLR